MHRLFVALRPPPEIRAMLLAHRGSVPGARWQDDDALHLTVRFIGGVTTPAAEEVAGALGNLVAPPPIVAIDGVGSFERRGRVDTIWAAVRPTEALTALHRKVDAAIVRAGLPPEARRYVPHITLARIGRAGADATAIKRWIASNAALVLPPFAATRLVLYESTLGHAGAGYEAIARWPLAG